MYALTFLSKYPIDSKMYMENNTNNLRKKYNIIPEEYTIFKKILLKYYNLDGYSYNIPKEKVFETLSYLNLINLIPEYDIENIILTYSHKDVTNTLNKFIKIYDELGNYLYIKDYNELYNIIVNRV